MSLTVVCGADYLTYWRAFTDSPEPAPDPRIRLLGFVSDVRPLYVESNLVLVPTTVSAGTNVKVLEAMAMERAVISTSSGCAGLGLLHGHSVWVADSAVAFAAGVATLINDAERRAPDGARRLRGRAAQLRLGRHRRKAARAASSSTHCPRVILRDVMPFLISTCSVACRPPFSIMIGVSPQPERDLRRRDLDRCVCR